jgi:hypothetical protein
MQMARFVDPREALDAARSLETTATVLRELATYHHAFVRAAVACHPATEPDVLSALLPAKLDERRFAEIAVALAGNPRTPATSLSRLAAATAPLLGQPREHELAFELGVLLCGHPETPFASVQLLLMSRGATSQFRKVVARETARADVLALLHDDRSEIVQRALARRVDSRSG